MPKNLGTAQEVSGSADPVHERPAASRRPGLSRSGPPVLSSATTTRVTNKLSLFHDCLMTLFAWNRTPNKQKHQTTNKKQTNAVFTDRSIVVAYTMGRVGMAELVSSVGVVL